MLMDVFTALLSMICSACRGPALWGAVGRTIFSVGPLQPARQPLHAAVLHTERWTASAALRAVLKDSFVFG